MSIFRLLNPEIDYYESMGYGTESENPARKWRRNRCRSGKVIGLFIPYGAI